MRIFDSLDSGILVLPLEILVIESSLEFGREVFGGIPVYFVPSDDPLRSTRGEYISLKIHGGIVRNTRHGCN